MKPTNDERREVAARLRELADANEGCLGIGRVNRVLRDGQEILGTSGLTSVADVLRRHADLIDPPTCKNLATHLVDELVCSACGERVDIAYLDSDDDYHVRYCPGCGAKVVG